MPWFQFYPNDWLAGTRGLSAVETGIYITIIATLYDRAAPLPNDPDKLARMCGASRRIFVAALARLVSDGKLTITENGIWNARVEDELQNRNEKVEKKKKAADARWIDKTEENQCNGDADALQVQCETDAISEVRSQMSDIRKSARIDDAPKSEDPPHWAEVQTYLKDRTADLTDWEIEFLHSIKWVPSLSASRADTLKGIRSKLKPMGEGGGAAVVVKRGTPEFAAWIEFKRGQGLKVGFLESQREITVPSLLPPSKASAA